jgi:hypothetical protein
MGCIGRCLLQCPADHRGDLVIADAARRSGAGLVIEPVEPPLGKAPLPLAERRPFPEEWMNVAIRPRSASIPYLSRVALTDRAWAAGDLVRLPVMG